MVPRRRAYTVVKKRVQRTDGGQSTVLVQRFRFGPRRGL